MAKKSSESDASESSPGRPTRRKTARRVTDRQPPPGDAADAVASHDVGPEMASQQTPADVASHAGQNAVGSDGGQETAPRQTPADVAPAPPPAQSQPSESASSEPSEAQIRLRAYLRYLERGAGDGADFDDWLQAEMELRKK